MGKDEIKEQRASIDDEACHHENTWCDVFKENRDAIGGQSIEECEVTRPDDDPSPTLIEVCHFKRSEVNLDQSKLGDEGKDDEF